MVLSSKELFTMGLRLDATTWLFAPIGAFPARASL